MLEAPQLIFLVQLHSSNLFSLFCLSKAGIKVNWGTSFSLEEIEQAYNSNKSLRLTQEETSTASMLTTAANGASTGPVSSKMTSGAASSIPKLTIEEEKGDEGDDVKGTEKAAGDTSTSQSRIESDPFRIQRGLASDAKQTAQPISRNASSDASDSFVQTIKLPLFRNFEGKNVLSGKCLAEDKTSTKRQGDTGILDHVRIVFPSVYNAFLSHPAFEGDREQCSLGGEAAQNPIITFDPHLLQQSTGEETLNKFDLLYCEAGVSDTGGTFLSDERYEYWRLSSETEAHSSWIRLLRQPVQKSNDVSQIESRKQNALSLALLLVTGMEAFIMAAYENVHGNRTGNSDVDAEGIRNFDIVEGIGMKSARIPSTVIAEAVDRFASTMSSAGIMRIVRPVSDLISGGKLEAQWETSLCLIPLWLLLRSKDLLDLKSSAANLISWNTALGMSMRALLDDSMANGCCQIDVKGVADELASSVHGSGLIQSCDELGVQEVSTTHVSAKKRRRKNKPKKVKIRKPREKAFHPF